MIVKLDKKDSYDIIRKVKIIYVIQNCFELNI